MNPGNPFIDSDMLYAAKTLCDDKNRRLAWGFVFEGCGWEAHRTGQVWEPTLKGRNWYNALSFPRELKISKDGCLEQSFPEELANLRKSSLSSKLTSCEGKWLINEDTVHGCSLPDYAYSLLDGVNGNRIEISLKIKLGSARKAGVLVRCSNNLSEATGISINRDTNSVHIEDLCSGFEAAHTRMWDNFSGKPSMPVSMPLLHSAKDSTELRIIVDGSIIEISIDNRLILTSRCYTKEDTSIHVGLFTAAGEAEFSDIRSWELGL